MAPSSGSQSARQLHKAWGDWLDGQPWDHYVTLTFKKESGPDVAKSRFARWIRRLEQEAQLPLLWFVGFENGKQLGRLHLHALVGNTRALPVSTMAELWQHGWSRIMPYRPTLGAAHYVTKYVTKELLDYDISPKLARALTLPEQQFAIDLAPATDDTRNHPSQRKRT